MKDERNASISGGPERGTPRHSTWRPRGCRDGFGNPLRHSLQSLGQVERALQVPEQLQQYSNGLVPPRTVGATNRALEAA